MSQVAGTDGSVASALDVFSPGVVETRELTGLLQVCVAKHGFECFCGAFIQGQIEPLLDEGVVNVLAHGEVIADCTDRDGDSLSALFDKHNW